MAGTVDVADVIDGSTLHIVNACKHLVPRHAADEFIRLAGLFLKA
jgi:hypothetical protein